MGAICSNCETEFDVFLSACPSCGSGNRNVYVAEIINGKDSLERNSLREFYETNHKLKWLTIGISMMSILLGLILNKWEAIFVGVILWIPTYLLGRKSEIKVIERDRYKVD